MFNKTKTKSAFTLAEVLITLVIIGVVAALTITPLISDINDSQDIKRLKKNYSIIRQAINSAISKHGPVMFWENLDNAYKYLSDELVAVKKDFYLDNISNYSRWYNLNGLENKAQIAQHYKAFILNDGTYIGLTTWNSAWCENINGRTYCFRILVDINGAKKPNRFGYDLFEFLIFPDEQRNHFLPNGLDRCNPVSDTSSDGNPNGISCSNWVIRNNNMDYKKCLKGNQKYCNTVYSQL